VDIRVLPDLAIMSGSGTMRKNGRTRELIADGNESLVLHIATCAGLACQFGREVPVEVGDAIVLSTSDVGSFTFASQQSVLALNVPRAVLGPFLHDPDAALVRAVPTNNAALRLLKSYVAAITHERDIEGEELQRLAAGHVHDLVALVLGATYDAAETARVRG